jgi:hypothetical protein
MLTELNNFKECFDDHISNSILAIKEQIALREAVSSDDSGNMAKA